jgi:hypothetical protein
MVASLPKSCASVKPSQAVVSEQPTLAERQIEE